MAYIPHIAPCNIIIGIVFSYHIFFLECAFIRYIHCFSKNRDMWHDLHFSHHGHKLLCGDTQAAGATHAELEYTRKQAFRNNPSKYHLIIKDVDYLKAPGLAVGSKVLPCMVFYHLTSFVVWRVTFGFFYFIFFH